MGGKSSDRAAKRAAYAQYQVGKEAIKASSKDADRMLDLAEREQKYLERTVGPIAESQRLAQERQMGWAEDDRRHYSDTFRPIERGLINDALTYDTAAQRERLAQLASADYGLAANTMFDANRRAAAQMGVNPNSGRFASMGNASNLQLAAGRADAMNRTRTDAENEGLRRRYTALGLGSPLASQALTASAQATSAGNSAAGNYALPGQVMAQGLANAANTRQNGYQLGAGAIGGAANSYGSIYNSNAQQQGSMWGAAGNILGMGLGAYGAFKMNPVG